MGTADNDQLILHQLSSASATGQCEGCDAQWECRFRRLQNTHSSAAKRLWEWNSNLFPLHELRARIRRSQLASLAREKWGPGHRSARADPLVDNSTDAPAQCLAHLSPTLLWLYGLAQHAPGAAGRRDLWRWA